MKIEKSRRKYVFCRYSLLRVTALVMVGVFMSGLFPVQARADQAPPSVSASSPPPAAASPAVAPMDDTIPPEAGTGSPSNSTLDAAEGSGIGNTSMASVDPSTGVAHASIPFQLPHARGQVQPHLGISYSSAAGWGDVGFGWSLDLPRVERHNLFGGPQYNDPAPGTAIDPAVEDHFQLMGQDLVPVCLLKGGQCTNSAALPAGERFPAYDGIDVGNGGWMYYRPAVDRGFMRAFWSPDHLTWLVQSRGVTMEFGAPVDTAVDNGNKSGGLDFASGQSSGPVFRWQLVRQYDATGRSNAIVYDWQRDSNDGLTYLSDVYFSAAYSLWYATTSRVFFAHHVHLIYSWAGVPAHGSLVVWRRKPSNHLSEVRVTSAPFKEASAGQFGQRSLVRHYYLDYGGFVLAQDRPRLEHVLEQGECAIQEDSDGNLPNDLITPCPGTPFRYTAKLEYWGNDDVVVPKALGDFRHGNYGEVLVDLDGDGAADSIGLGSGSNPKAGVVLRPASVSAGAAMPVIVQDDPNLDSSGYALTLSAQMGGWLRDKGSLQGLLIGRDLNNPMWATRQLIPLGDGTLAWSGPPADDQHRLHDWALGAMDPPVASYFADLDGDGYLDRIGIIDSGDGDGVDSGDLFSTFLTTLDSAGNVQPFQRQTTPFKIPWFGKYTPQDPCCGKPGYLTDLNGDGALDLVRYLDVVSTSKPAKEVLAIWYGRGDGSFDGPTLSNPYVPRAPSDTNPTVRSYSHDVNGDGVADSIVVTVPIQEVESPAVPSLDITFMREDGTINYTVHVDVPWDVNQRGTEMPIAFGDLNATGIDSIVLGHQYAFSVSGMNGPDDHIGIPQEQLAPGLLKSITDDNLVTTTLEYDTASRNSAELDTRKVPVPLHIVNRITVSSPADTAITGGPFVTSYFYYDPVYDPTYRRFLGFHRVMVIRGQQANSVTTLTTTTTFLVGDCSDFLPLGQSCGYSPTMPDNAFAAVKGLPVLVDQSAGSPGPGGSVTHYTYHLRPLYQGMDGRVVRTTFLEQKDTWLDDEPAGTTQSLSAYDVLSDDGKVQPPSRTFTVRQAAGGSQRVHLLSEMVRDNFGNVISKTDFGIAAAGTDYLQDQEVYQQFTNWSLPPGDPTAWNWRASDAYVGDRHTHSTYNSAGKVTDVYADLTGTLPLARFHEDPTSEVAPTPADASQDAKNLLRSHIDYDTWGNAQTTTGPDGQCATVTYDPTYHQLPIATSVFTHGCGGAALTSSVEYDRGLEVATKTTDARGAVSKAEYDGWGRPLKTYAPDPHQLGATESDPATKMTYTDPNPNTPYRKVQVDYRDDDGSAPRYRSRWTYIDPFGQVAASIGQGDTPAGDLAPFIVSGEAERDVVGHVLKRYAPRFATVDPTSLTPPAHVPLALATTFEYNDTISSGPRFVRTHAFDGSVAATVYYRSLSELSYIGGDVGTVLPTRTVHDGFGRTSLVTQDTLQNGAPDTIATKFSYLPTGELYQVMRTHAAAGNDMYHREMRYDSFGRMVQNDEPNTSADFGTSTIKSWRYAYNDAGQLVGTSDARGCGKNLEYDGAGRTISETYSPCLKSQAPYQQDKVTNLFIYDAPEQGQAGDAALYVGRLAASYDRAQHSQISYDARGRVVGVARQLAIPSDAEAGGAFDAAATPGGEYASHWYRSATAYDEADRVIAQSMGADVPELQGASISAGGLTGTDLVTTSYTMRGIANKAAGSYGDLLTGEWVTADGLEATIAWGDAAPTWEQVGLDARRRLRNGRVFRLTSPSFWSQGSAPSGYTAPDPSGTAQTLLSQFWITYDQNDNPTSVTDERIASEWPAGAKPVNRTLSYDDLNQLREVDYAYATDTKDDAQVSPSEAEKKNHDPRPIPEQTLAKRVRSQTFDYDWQGNLTKSDDDAHAFFDRSMGSTEHGTSANGPNRAVASTMGDGNAAMAYDAAGNLASLVMSKPGPDGSAMQLQFAYEWDEVGELVRATRAPIAGTGDSGVDYRYTYDAGGQRVLKSVMDPATQDRRYSGDVLGTLRLKMAPFKNGDFQRTPESEMVYLAYAGGMLGHVTYDSGGSLPSLNGSKQHVYLVINDALGSTTNVIDKATSELVEHVTYQAYGATESDYRPARWQSFREDYRFTGKEDDVGVGLMYFGARYYVPALGQWASADPLTVHGVGGDVNPYAFVAGSPQRNVDPTGLDICSGNCEEGNGEGGGFGWGSFVAGMEASSLGWTSSYGGDELSNSGMLPMTETIQYYKRTDESYMISSSESDFVEQGYLMDPEYFHECGGTSSQSSVCGDHTVMQYKHASSMWEPIGEEEAYRIDQANRGAIARMYTSLTDHRLERPIIDPIDIAAGGIGGLGRAAARGIAAGALEGVIADELGGLGSREAGEKLAQELAKKAAAGVEDGTVRVLQSGGNTISKSTARALGLTQQQARDAMHAMKPDVGASARDVGKIMSNGDYVEKTSGMVLGNLFDYVD